MRLLGWAFIQDVCCPYKKKPGHRYTEGWACEDLGRRRPSACQAESSEDPSLWRPWPWTSSLQDWEEINVFHLSRTDCVSLFMAALSRLMQIGTEFAFPIEKLFSTIFIFFVLFCFSLPRLNEFGEIFDLTSAYSFPLSPTDVHLFDYLNATAQE